MISTSNIQIIWLVTHRAEDCGHYALERKSQSSLEPTDASPPNVIRGLISVIEQYVCPISFAHTYDRAIELIETHPKKQVFFVSSQLLTQQMVSAITSAYPYVVRWYMFSDDTTHHIELNSSDTSCGQMFAEQTDLVIRLASDICRDKIKQGEIYLKENNAKHALHLFRHALMLNMEVNKIMNKSCLTYLEQLEGDGVSMGLIQQANDMLSQQQKFNEEKLSQEESQNNQEP